MNIETFEMERLQCTWENRVDCDLSESGTRGISLRELATWGLPIDPLLDMPLSYSQTNGTQELRELLALQYPGSTVDNVMVTNGSAESNYLLMAALLHAGDNFAMELPNYMQVKGLGAFWTQRPVSTFNLRADAGWEPDWDEFERAVRPGTKVVYITNPNNPTGAILSDTARRRIVDRCDAVGAWLLVDEIYIGTEIDRPRTETMFGMSDRVVVVSGLSKAYGIPGARIGWLVGTPALAAEVWRLHDYTTIGPSKLSDAIAQFAVRPDIRERLYQRSHGIVREQLPLVEAFARRSGGLLDFTRPASTSMAFMRYHGPESTADLCERLLQRRSLLVVDGKLLGQDGYVRVWVGAPREKLEDGLARFEEELGLLTPALAGR